MQSSLKKRTKYGNTATEGRLYMKASPPDTTHNIYYTKVFDGKTSGVV